MTTVLASTLSDTPVLGSDGTEIGTVHNVTMDVETGRLAHLLVSPATERSYGFARTEDGRLRVPAGRMVDVGDYVVIDRSVE
ncbi:Sporulation protein YlmC, PRC-barrel domain family [Halobiforma haloterrestris]|uniref:Sporulation protein YlmC, PRC-barrel domain family n=1 Tax=Natronobacterium haloterrestre TaxID=148448 RepID=A0A1I1GH14_NATHA|nr:PRC-barrel domain-containing protein [Halobiforma haloterrestris]SFC11069.1 Sporulation protein YlmC, PRC-barrel domain family [Halobiforma haloterrestris]